MRRLTGFGLELHAWFCVFADIKFAQERPDLAMVDVNNVVSTEWVCPKKEQVRKYMKNLISEVAFKYNVDGIHLDYIRYPDRTYCYCNVCQENWINEHPEISWPPEPANPTFIHFKQKHITSFVEETRMMLKGINPKIKLSAAVFPIPEDAANNMMYTNVPCQFGDWLEKILKTVKGKTLVYPGIGLYLLAEASNPNDALKEQVNKTRYVNVTINCLTLKADGYVLFRYKYIDLFGEALKQLNAQQALPPHSEEFPPEIEEPLQIPSDVEPHQSVTITVNVTDYPTRINNATLWYKANNGTVWITTMTQIYQNTYQAIIPGYDNCITIAYKIEAYDVLGNKAVKDNDGLWYTYHVPEFPLIITLLLFISLTTLAIILTKHANRRF